LQSPQRLAATLGGGLARQAAVLVVDLVDRDRFQPAAKRIAEISLAEPKWVATARNTS
jgi:hypothetical protein